MRENYVTFIIYCGFFNFILHHHLILFSFVITWEQKWNKNIVFQFLL